MGASCHSAGCHMENGNKFTARARYVYVVVVVALLWVQVVTVLVVTWKTGTSLLPEQGMCMRLLWWHCCGHQLSQCRLSHGERGTSLLPGQGMCMRLLWGHCCGCRLSQCCLSHGEREQVYCQGKVCVCGCCGGTIVGAGCHSAGCHMENRNKFTARARYVYAVVVVALLWAPVVTCWLSHGERGTSLLPGQGMCMRLLTGHY